MREITGKFKSPITLRALTEESLDDPKSYSNLQQEH